MRQRQRHKSGVETGRERSIYRERERDRKTDRWVGVGETDWGRPREKLIGRAKNLRNSCCDLRGWTAVAPTEGDELNYLYQEALPGTLLRSDIITSSGKSSL